MSSQYFQSPQFTVNITCPKCATPGVIVWEKGCDAPTLVSLSKGFYERISKKDPYPIELVCHECGMVQPEG